MHSQASCWRGKASGVSQCTFTHIQDALLRRLPCHCVLLKGVPDTGLATAPCSMPPCISRAAAGLPRDSPGSACSYPDLPRAVPRCSCRPVWQAWARRVQRVRSSGLLAQMCALPGHTLLLGALQRESLACAPPHMYRTKRGVQQSQGSMLRLLPA